MDNRGEVSSAKAVTRDPNTPKNQLYLSELSETGGNSPQVQTPTIVGPEILDKLNCHIEEHELSDKKVSKQTTKQTAKNVSMMDAYQDHGMMFA